MINNEIIKLKFDNSFNGRLFAVQGDTGRVFNLQIFDDFSKPVDVTGMKLRMYVANSKEVSYSEGEIVTAAEGKIKVQVYNSQLKYPGKQKAQFIITDKDGQKIGSKIFDLWIEEGLEAGPTVGRNIYVDFERINEALNLIKDYDKTLEEAKEVDASLKVGINEGIEARNNLADCKKKAFEIKGELDTSKVEANKTLDDLNKTKTESETLKSNLTSENQKATENIKDLTNKIDTGKTASNELNQIIEDAKANKTNLDKSNTTALATKKSLEDATTAADTTKENLTNLKNQGDTLSGDLTTKITDGNKLKSNLDASVSDAASTKSDLDTSVETATSTNTTLKATDTEAKRTEALIKDLMSQLNLTKDEVSKIIAAGDLSQYVTNPKLREALQNYATKDDLSKIDVTSQLVDYAKKTEIPTKLSELQSDINNRTVTDAEKSKLANIEDGAEKNKVNSVNNKVGNVVLKLSDLENDKNFKTEVEIQELINNSTKLKKEVVTSLPSTGKDDVIYLLKNKNDTNNYYTEYMWISGKWEIIGDTKVDLSGYAKKSELPKRLSEFTSDSTHRTVTDAEKQSWNNPPKPDLSDYVKKEENKVLSTNDYTNKDKSKVDGVLDKQYLYDILIGESLVTRKTGEWPVVHGTPKKIDNNAFKDQGLVSVNIPPSVEEIGSSAFDGNDLTSVNIPNSVRTIGVAAFSHNYLASVKIPRGVESIHGNAFEWNSLVSVNIPFTLTGISEGVFRFNQLTVVNIPHGVEFIGKWAFTANNIYILNIPRSVKEIGEEAFKNNYLTEVKIPRECTIAPDAFDEGVKIVRY